MKSQYETHFKQMADRQVRAMEEFKSTVESKHGFTPDQADIIFRVFVSKKAKVLKYDNGAGRYNVIHGAFWDKEVMQNALDSASEFI